MLIANAFHNLIINTQKYMSSWFLILQLQTIKIHFQLQGLDLPSLCRHYYDCTFSRFRQPAVFMFEGSFKASLINVVYGLQFIHYH